MQGKAGTDSTLGWGVVSMDGRVGGGSPRGRGYSQLQMLLLLLDCLLPLAPLYTPEMTILEREAFSIFQSRLHKDGRFPSQGHFEDCAPILLVLKPSVQEEKEFGHLKESVLE